MPPENWHLSRSCYINNAITFIHVESTSCQLALKPSLFNYSPIHNHYFSSGELPSSALLRSCPGKHNFCASTFRASQVSPVEGTHIPRTSVSPEVNTHVGHRVSGTSLYAGLALGKLPTRQSLSSLWSPCFLILITQLGRVSPYDDEISPPRSGL